MMSWKEPRAIWRLDDSAVFWVHGLVESPGEPHRSRIQGYSRVSRTRSVDARSMHRLPPGHGDTRPTGVSPTLPCTSRFYGEPPSLKSPSLPRGDPTWPLVTDLTAPAFPGGGVPLQNPATTSAPDVLNPARPNLCPMSLGDR
ncbi:hypothetical protein C8Q76DRAFT_709878 [Earliella scabrosa]|nr:hypothetical protein C8Q76DRAFT_709878 [Earliella scabrosa]